jgi:hypothetical protein
VKFIGVNPPSYLEQEKKKREIRVKCICPAGQSFVRNWIDHCADWHLRISISDRDPRCVAKALFCVCVCVCVTHHEDYAYTHVDSVNVTVLENAQKCKDVGSGYEKVIKNIN